MLKHLKRVFVQFTPGDPNATSAREFLRQVSGAKAKKSNPACSVEYKVVDHGHMDAYIDVVFNDDTPKRINAKDMDMYGIAKYIKGKSNEMEMQSLMKDVSYNPWSADTRLIGHGVQQFVDEIKKKASHSQS
jgi:large subunit ribosomal protein L53